MDLLQENQKRKKNKKTPAQKVVLSLLIISIILCFIVGAAMFYTSLQGEKKPYSITISGQLVNLNKLNVMTSENGKMYISLHELSDQLGYNYFNGEFRIPGEGGNKGYINNNKNIIQFFTDSKTIYKTTENSKTDYEYYNLENPILEYEDNIYIAVNDIAVALNLIVSYSEVANQTSIETPEKWVQNYEKKFKEQGNIILSNEPENLRAMSYGYLVINKDNKYGVISLHTGEEIIGNKYASIVFCEYKNNFIVSNTTNKYGVITKSGIAEIDLQYDSFEILNYDPLLYQVERLGKFGVITEKGNLIDKIEYSVIGYPENKSKEIKYSLIVPNLNENIPQSIIVCKDKKYGLIELETGREIIPCIVEGIYTKENSNETYYVQMQNKNEYTLETFVENLNRLTTSVE